MKMFAFFKKHIIIFSIVILFTALVGLFIYVLSTKQNTIISLQGNISSLKKENEIAQEKIASISAELEVVKNTDEKLRNDALEHELSQIKSTIKLAVGTYEDLLKLKEISKKTEQFDKEFTKSLMYISNENLASGSASLNKLSKNIAQEKKKIENSFIIPSSVIEKNSPPISGYSRQKVISDVGTFMVSIQAADLASTRVIVDTASKETCHNDCPVLPLSTYISRNGAFAGINGSYFCPASYPSCAGKTNSFDTLLMNKNKIYFNSENNIYSTVPVVIFGNGWIRFEAQSLNWGRDTSVDSVIANQSLLILGGDIAFEEDTDPKKGSKAGRSFVANKENIVYIGVVHNATVVEAAHVLKTLGMDNALNLDSGGSTAFWSGEYKVGPGRNIPNAILFIRK